MPTWYSPATEELNDAIAEVIDAYYPDLVEAHAKIGAILAHPDPDTDKPPLMKNGLQILAKIKANSEADRVDGKPDATITFDASHVVGLDDDLDGREQLLALIDHELYHLEVRREKDSGRIVTDDAGRPKFKIRPHDWEITGFRAVAARHKQHAAEVIEARRFHDKYGNLLFSFAEDRAVQGTLDLGNKLVERAVERINAGAIGPGVTAEVVGPHWAGPTIPADGAVAAANR